METIRLKIEYDGSDFHGWQRQADKPTVQAMIEDALTHVMEKKVVIIGASRTDSGVHARGQVAHFRSYGKVAPHKWRDVLNFMLPKSIRIVSSDQVDHRFHAQKDATSKIYDYRILNRPFASALDRRVYFYPRRLDWQKMRQALPYFVGEKDFKSFQSAGTDLVTTTRRVLSFELHEEYDGLFRFRIEGTGFLKQMVRNIIGTIIEVGEGKRPPESIPEIFASRDRCQAGRTVPAQGLCLSQVNYV